MGRWKCSECEASLAEAATARRQRGLPQRSPFSATCSDRCERAREARFQREAAARGSVLEPGDWRCDECGCTAPEALARGERAMSTRAQTCSPECAERRTARKTAAIMREAQRSTRVRLLKKQARQRPKPEPPRSWQCAVCGISREQAQRERRGRGQRALAVNAVTCGAVTCARERERRRLQEKPGPGSGYRYPLPHDWCCPECHCSVEEAHAKREARSLHPLTRQSRTCSPECGRARMIRRAAAARVRTPEQKRRTALRAAARAKARRKALLPLDRSIREARQRQGLTQAALAERAGLTRSFISMLEGGWLTPAADALERLARALGLVAMGL